MNISPPKIIQGGMGASISNWRLAQAVSRMGQLGVVSGTALDNVLTRRLQDGDPGGMVRQALDHFPFQDMARRVMDKFYIPEGRAAETPYRAAQMHSLNMYKESVELCILGNFVEIFLARQGHDNPVGINYLEKIQIPHLASIYGAMLAGVAVIIMGAGIPLAVPEILTAFTQHEQASYPVLVQSNGSHETVKINFNPKAFAGTDPLPPPLSKPDFLPIVSSEALAGIMFRKAGAGIDGFIVELNIAGGHNAPPRGKRVMSAEGEPVYGVRDEVNVEAFAKMEIPFWLAGGFGSAEALQQALRDGAAGVQVGTAFALCEESGLAPDMRTRLIEQVKNHTASVFTDPLASPTGFPFKVARLEGTLSEESVYQERQRVCDLGFLRQAVRGADGKILYRCPAEPVDTYLTKGGRKEDTVGRKCLCNALIANAGMPQILKDGAREPCLITMGDDLLHMDRFISDTDDFTVQHVIRTLLGA